MLLVAVRDLTCEGFIFVAFVSYPVACCCASLLVFSFFLFPNGFIVVVTLSQHFTNVVSAIPTVAIPFAFKYAVLSQLVTINPLILTGAAVPCCHVDNPFFIAVWLVSEQQFGYLGFHMLSSPPQQLQHPLAHWLTFCCRRMHQNAGWAHQDDIRALSCHFLALFECFRRARHVSGCWRCKKASFHRSNGQNLCSTSII